MSDPILFTPGPLTTDIATRRAMLRDWGSRDPAFIAVTAELRKRLLEIAHGEDSHVAVPLQGSGTFIVEAAIATLIGPTDKLLILANGAYGERMAVIAQRLGRQHRVLRWPEDTPVDPVSVKEELRKDATITHVAIVHCETTTGLLNSLEQIAQGVAAAGRQLIVDAMSSFGALDLDLQKISAVAVLASSNKCLEGVPGIGLAIVEREAIARAKGNSPSLSLDLHDHWRGFERNGQWRFTPPVQVVAALVEALYLLDAEGGPAARLRRYQENFDLLAGGMRRLGFELYLAPADQSPIIATFRSPKSRAFDFKALYHALAERGFLIYPGKLTKEETFRIGCIGAINRTHIEKLLAAIAEILNSDAPAPPAP